MLPKEFLDLMKEILTSKIDVFIKSYDENNVRAFKVNTNKISLDQFNKLVDWKIQKIEYEDAYYLLDDLKLGNHPYHQSGMIYSQDPSAMIPVNAIDIKSDYHVLDLCASPGGKTFQLASSLKNGILVSNEISHERSKILQSNIERLGLKNVIQMSMPPSFFKECYQNSFDLILIDAPCSGEGMFRKYPESINEWSLENVGKSAARQKEIIDNVIPCVKEKGYIIYSTCTFNLEENEKNVQYILDSGLFELITVNEVIRKHTVDGIPINGNEELKKCRRFYPHIGQGEGQFVAVLKRIELNKPHINEKSNIELTKSEMEIISDFVSKVLVRDIPIIKYKDTISAFDSKGFALPHRGVISCGVKIGDIIKNRLLPHHHFFKAYGEDFVNKLDLKIDDPRINQYLEGLEIRADDIPNGFGVFMLEGLTLGGFKAVNGRLKNHYPKGLRKKKHADS
jgi:NOL1/NOP2/sun family putative RNA methylase